MLQDQERQALLQPDEARQLTDRIKAGAEELWHMLLEAYEGGAHTVLGYSSWGAYFEAEFGGHQSRAYQLIDASRVVRALEGDSTIVERPNEAQARELAPLVKEDPETAKRIWGGLSAKHGDDLTAKHVAKAVKEVRESKALREELPPSTRTVVENSDPEDCSLSRNVPQLKHLRDIAAKRGDEVAAEAAERVANGEFKSTFDAYPEVKAENEQTASKPEPEPEEPTVGDLPKDALKDLPPFDLPKERKVYYQLSGYLIGLKDLDPEMVASECEGPDVAERDIRHAEGIVHWFNSYKEALQKKAAETESSLRRVK